MANEGADIIAVDIAAPLPPSVPYRLGHPRGSGRDRPLAGGHRQAIIATAADTRDHDALRTIVSKESPSSAGST